MAYGSILGKSATTWSNSEILSSETAGLLGLGSGATPNDAFGLFASFKENIANQYVWAKYTIANEAVVSEQSFGTVRFYNSNSYMVSAQAIYINGTATLINQITITDNSSANQRYYLNGSSLVYLRTSTVTINYVEYNMFSTTIGDAFPYEIVEYCMDESNEKYPEYGIQEGYFYVFLGRIGGSAKIVTGSYIGLGVCGKNNPNVLNVEFDPKLLIIRTNKEINIYNNYNDNSYIFIKTQPQDLYVISNGNYSWNLTIDWKSGAVSYWSNNTSEAAYQFNFENQIYYYLVAG